MTKKILSLLLCVMMLASFCVVSANAEAPTRVLNDMDSNGSMQYFGPNNQGFTGALSTVDYTTVDPTYTDGKVMQIYIKNAVNYGGWCFNLDSSWASAEYDLPVTLKFQIWSDTAGLYLGRSSGLSKDSKNSWTPTDVKTTFQQLGMSDMLIPTEPTWVTIDLTKVAVPYTSRLGMRLNITNTPAMVYLDNFILEYEENESKKASFDVDGVEDVVADVNGNITLPDVTVEGKHLIGWLDEAGTLCKAGETIRLRKSTAFTALTTALDIQTGAGIRWAETESERGIRFETYVSKEALDTLGSSAFEIGSLILPYKNYDASITVENASTYGAVRVVDTKVYGEIGENYRYYTGVVDFEKYFAVSQAALADLKLTAVSYLKVTYPDQSTAYFYDHPDAVDNVRTVSEVARAALADTEFGYTEGQIKILNLYTKYSEKTNVPSYRTDPEDNPNALPTYEFQIVPLENKQGSGFSSNSQNNGVAINEFTPDNVSVNHYANTAWTVGGTASFTLPSNIKMGTYKISFNTRGISSRASAKIEVVSNTGTKVADESASFATTTTAAPNYWYNVECANAVEILGETTINLTCTAAGGMYLYDVVLTPVK